MIQDQHTAQLMQQALHTEYGLYQAILERSQKQLGLMKVNEPDTEKIAVLMDEKVQIKNEIEQIEAEHQSIKKQWEEVYEAHSTEDREKVRHIRDRLMELLETLQQLEEQVSGYLQAAERDISDQLRNIYKARSVNRAYFHAEKNPPQYVNRLSK